MISASRLVLVLLALSAVAPVRADVTVPAIFSDHLVLQREQAVPVWGWADPGEQVSVTAAGQTQTARAAADGKWMVRFSALRSAGPTTVTIAGKNTIVINDVLIGEVWLGSGQSNLAFTLSRTEHPEAEAAAANYPLIRYFKEESHTSATPQRIGQGQWVPCSPDNAASFSAVLYYFGRELHRTLQVPVGLVHSAVGGTAIEAWIDYETQKKVPELQEFFKIAAEEKVAAGDATPAKAGKAASKGKAGGAKKKSAAVGEARYGGLFNGKITPLIPYAIRGMLWYQGEANTRPTTAPYYEKQLRLLVTDWRSRWGWDFPVAWAQLPNYSAPGRDWPLVREAMLKSLALPKTGMAITIDIGEEDNLHPRNKLEVARRFALWAFATVYGRNVPSISGPLPTSHEVRGGEVVVRFRHADAGLIAKGGALKAFAVAGEDRQWRPAQARIVGESVVLSSPEVNKPVAARYGWENSPTCNLYNGAGLPATPFRTDEWK